MIQWVWENACKISLFDSVTLAIDDEETEKVVQQFGGNYRMTPKECPCGTLRLCTLIKENPLEGDIFVNWQGDEPFLHEAMIRELLQTVEHDTADIWTLKKRIEDPNIAASPHTVKVVADKNGHALYFSRSLIPYSRDQSPCAYDKHIGIYAYKREALEKLPLLPNCSLAEIEQIEALKFLYHGFKVRVHETHHDGFGIDTPEHLALAQKHAQHLNPI